MLDTVDSTMAEAARRAASGLAGPTWIMAHQQTSGRGRRGRDWSSQPGNLAATLVYKPEATPAEAARRSFLAAVALFEALAIHVDRTRLSLKWPNDVLLDGGKVAGILLESAGQGPYVDWLAIGVGVNLASRPAGLRGVAFPPVAVADNGGPLVDPEEFLTHLADAFATEEGKLDAFGFGRIREDWLRHAARLGEVITARTGADEITGVFENVDEAGNLMLRTPKGLRAISAADVFF
ncbi:BirA family biotin operon repressor/biotin-[acetyl-CoA-carboxylase] ligase [Limimaricola soesokkakensis]|uniref:biotin--[biotin carboxyl-carrier protein] ligase n=1 Tax=Limimaricola soesokkakensis TaxID=1343159 RepID=A0A1X6YET3_9RHOB|nr:biotin--[acetyl-CoA-carboxylase] ligase [Limimaricola soesokkakensis]PSK82207.1 BirA family biotin operon repressor/biotin-[acetyl-CoA-carboxylase] ligase [Limimaricola soesokkakensis]SLN18816.1 Bifunctional ligase/repressor BirA [Limimaricola soesokkakensis]